MLENEDTITSDTSLKKKARKKQKRKNRDVKFYLSFMTIVLLACVIQLAMSAILNITKIISFETKIAKAQQLKEQAEMKNKSLKSEIENFNSLQKVESIARNNLKMAGENEVLLIINEKDEAEKPKTNKEKFMEFFEEKISNKFFHSDNADDLLRMP